MLKLIGSATSPFVRKVRIVMAEKKLDCNFSLENVWTLEGAAAVSAINPLGKVPCLILDTGEAMYDSRVIVEYLDILSPVGRLIPASGRERADVKTWEALADGVVDAAVAAHLEMTWGGRTEAQRSTAWINHQMLKIHAGLQTMSTHLADKPFCAGIHQSLADIAVGVALGYLDFRFPNTDWHDAHHNLSKLQEKLSLKTSFIETAPNAITAKTPVSVSIVL